MSLEKNIVCVYFEFFRPVNLDKLEEQLRELVEKKQFPAFGFMIPMIDHKGLKQVGIDIVRKREYPLVISGEELFSRGKYEKVIRDAKSVESD